MSFVLEHIQNLKPYSYGDQPEKGAIKLNLNENPYPPSENVLQALYSTNEESIRRYPDIRCEELRKEIAGQNHTRMEEVYCGNGSSEILSLIFNVCIGSGNQAVIPYPSFFLYYSIAALNQVECINLALGKDFLVQPDNIINSHAKAAILVNPHAPTGTVLPVQEVERVVKNFKGLLIVDEAYIDYADSCSSSVPLIQKYPNLIVVRTLSKSSALCGIRVGYCISNEDIIASLEKSGTNYNVNAISQRLALASLRDQEYKKEIIRLVKNTRNSFSSKLKKLGFQVVPSQTNFILCTPPVKSGFGAKELYEKLRERNIYVRHFQAPTLHDKLRISIGTEAEMNTLFQELADLYS